MFRSIRPTMVAIVVLVCHASVAAEPVLLDVVEVQLAHDQGKWVERVIHSIGSENWEAAGSPTIVAVRLPAGTTTLPAGLVVQPPDKWSFRLAVSLVSSAKPLRTPLTLENYRERPVIVRPDKRLDIPGRLA